MTRITRVIRFGFQNFFRNFWLSAATVSVLTMTVISINMLVVVNVLGKIAVTSVESRIDVSAHFKPDVDVSRVQTVKVALLSMQEVRDVEFISSEDAFASFGETNGADADLMASLEEVDGNPFGATLVIRARDIADYPTIMQALSQPTFSSLIEEKDFDDREVMIERLHSLATRLELFALAITALFGGIALLITMNAVRVSIYTHKEEISIMRLVGASNWFIRGPFYIEAFIWTVISVGVTLAVLYPSVAFAQPFLQKFFGAEVDLMSFYSVNLVQIVGLQFLGVALLTFVTTKMATARYLRV
ncbi:MAG: permease-like cell division protein FtsX [Patescibacteria group bacterium]|nr:permease-like cell division protein FtsX [Patescibacteria group bacterium]